MSRHPWLTFVLVGLAPPLLLSGNVLGHSVALAALFPAVAAVLIVGGGEAPQPVPGHLAKRVLMVVGIVVVQLGVALAETRLANALYAVLVAAVPVALTAWVLSGVYSPSPAVRRLVRALASPASRPAWLVAAIAGPVAGVVAVLACGLLPGTSVVSLRASAFGSLAGWTVAAVFSSALAAVGWYGFGARRLLGRFSPLAAGLVIGVMQYLVTWPPMTFGLGLPGRFELWRLAGAVAAAVIGMWVCERSRGSLLPVWLLGTLLIVSRDVAFLLTTTDDPVRIGTMFEVFSAVEALAAVALVVTGRMWRRPVTGHAAKPAPDAAV